MKKKTKGYVAIIAAFFIPLIFSLFYLNMYVSEINHNRMIFENAVKQTALRVARHRLHNLDNGQGQTDHLNRVAAITFNDWMKVKSGLDKNVLNIQVNDILHGARQRAEFRHYSSKNGGFYTWCSQRHWLWSNYVEDFYDNYDPDNERVVDYVSVRDSSSDFNAEGYALSTLKTEPPSIIKVICQSTASNIKITNDNDENIQVEATAKLGKYNKTYKATYKASPPKLNADIVLCIPVNSAACNTYNDPYATEDQINNLYSNSTDYYNNAARDTPIWQIKTAFRHFIRQIIGYNECGIGLIPYCGNVAIHGWDYFDNRTVQFDNYHYANYDAVNPQVSVAESFKFATHENYHLSINKDKEHANWGPIQRSFTPFIYRSDINGMLESYMNDNSDGSDVLKSLYSLVDKETKFMRRAVDINPCGNINVLAGYSIRKENSYPHPYPMLGIIDKTSESYRYLTTFMPFADHSNKSNFLYLPLMFGASMLKNNFAKWKFRDNENIKNRKKCLILVDNMGDLFAPHELTYLGMSNDASCLTLVNGERLDYENGELELVDGDYRRNDIFTNSDYNNVDYWASGVFYNKHDEKVAIKCNYQKDSMNGTYTLKTPQPGNIKMVVKTADNLQSCAKLFQDNLHASDITISNVAKADDDETLAITDNYYTCNLNTSYKITFENIENRKSPVMARLELIECEIDSLMSLDNKYVLRQDENYVYICYGDDAYTNGIESGDSSLDQNAVIIKFKQATEVTDYFTLSYVGQAFLDSSVYFSPYTQTYVLGNVYNAVLDGSMNIDGNISNSYKQNGENVFYTGYSHYCPGSRVYYSSDKYDVEELCRLCLSNDGRPILQNDPWKELTSDWVYGYDNWNGFSYISDSSTLSDISAEYGSGEILAPNHLPDGESFPQIKVYKTNQYNNVVVNDVYTYTEGCFVADMGDYFNIYSILGNHPSLDITISNPDQVKNVYAKMETFGFDVNIYDSSTGVSWRQDNNYIYMCYQGELYYDSDSTGYIYGISTNECDSSNIFQSTNNIDELFSKFEVSGCTCGGGILDGDKYTHIVTKSEYDDLGTLGCMLNVKDSNVNVKYKTYYEGYSVYESSIVGAKEIFHGIDLSVKHDFNYSFCVSCYDDAGTVSDSSGCWYYPDYDTYYGPIDSYYPAIYKVIITGSAIDIKEECGCGMCKWTIDGEKTKFEYLAQTASDVDSAQHECKFKIQNAESIQLIYDINGNKATYYNSMDDYLRGKLLNFKISSSVYDYGSTYPMFKHCDSTYTYESSYWYEAESIMTITPNIQETTISRNYKSAEDGDKIPVPYAIVYKKPGHYVSSEEGHKIADNAEYDTVSYVSAADSSSIVKEVIDTNDNIIGWKCYVPDGLTYDVGSAKWQLNDYRISSRYIISFIDDLPAYPVLTKIKCFNVNIPGSKNDADNQDNVLIRQDGEYYYVCNRTSVDTELTSGISTADISFYQSTDPEEYKKLPLSYANMRLLWYTESDSANSYFSFYTDNNPYVVYSYNCNLYASALYSDTINNNSYTIDNLITGLNVHATHTESHSKKYDGCVYNDYFLSYKNTPDNEIFDSSAIISSISASKYQDKHREFKTTDASYDITLNSSKPSYSTSYTLTPGYNVIYIPRQGDKSITWDSTDTFDLNIGLNNAKICSIEWSNHLNGIEGCYPCESSDGYGATDDSGNLAVYYELAKRGKNCRWVDCSKPTYAASNDPSDGPWFHESLGVNCYDTSANRCYDNRSILDKGIYKDVSNIFHLVGKNLGRAAIWATTDANDDNISHGDFNFILNNPYRHSCINVWFAHLYKSYTDKAYDGTHISEYNYMNGVGRYFQSEHTKAYGVKDGFDAIVICPAVNETTESVILESIECTSEVNRILMAIGAQTLGIKDDVATGDLPDRTPTQALKEIVTPTMVKECKNALGENGRLYVIHYRKEGQEKPGVLANSDSQYNYYATNLDELNAALSSILVDIKEFSGSTDARIID